MTLGGWIMLLLAVGGMTIFLLWCIYKVITTPGASEHVHSQADIAPKDLER
jgi:hypothetical protein